MGRTIHYRTKEAVTAEELEQIRGIANKYNAGHDWAHENIKLWREASGTLLDASGTLRATDPSTGITVAGKLDALAQTSNGDYVIVDYKTGRPPEEIPYYYQMQLDGYAYLLERNGFKPVAGGVLLYFTPKHGDLGEGLFPFRITPVRAAVDSSRVLSALSRAKEILDMTAPPSRSEDCETCMWREQAEQSLSE